MDGNMQKMRISDNAKLLQNEKKFKLENFSKCGHSPCKQRTNFTFKYTNFKHRREKSINTVFEMSSWAKSIRLQNVNRWKCNGGKKLFRFADDVG